MLQKRDDKNKETVMTVIKDLPFMESTPKKNRLGSNLLENKIKTNRKSIRLFENDSEGKMTEKSSMGVKTRNKLLMKEKLGIENCRI